MLGQAFETIINTHEGKSGFLLIADNADAFISRIALCELAQHTLDIQYYIYHDDASGQLLRHKIVEAADRGVRVRILVDDINMGSRDTSFKLFDAHPNITVRIFNPLTNRSYFRNLELVINFDRAGRRMHNKAFIADSAVAIIGGRNIGDEYFDARYKTNYADLDLLTIGPIVKDVMQSFRDYWLSHWSISIDKISKIHIARRHVTSMRKRLKDKWNQSQNMAYFKALRHSHFANRLINDELEYNWATAQLFYDKPEKLLSHGLSSMTHMGPMVGSIIGQTVDSIYISTPYLVPGESSLKMMRDFRKKDVSIYVLTNSLSSTDAIAVHSGYRRYRKQLLHCDVNLYEYKPSARNRSLLSRFKKGKQQSSLHAKYIVSDNRYLFIGSSNIDPRSEYLNTEIGMVIHSEELSQQAIAIFKMAVSPENSYELKLDRREHLLWRSLDSGISKQYHSEPGASFWKKTLVMLISFLPVEKLL